MNIRTALLSLSFLFSSLVFGDATPILEHNLNYALKTSQLEKGDFQYFYALLHQKEDSTAFDNITAEQSDTPEGEILKTFNPLDIKKLWVPEEKHYLAVSKFSFMIPVPLQSLSDAELTNQKYLQSTLPKYEVTKVGNAYHVAGSFITPDFHATVTVLAPTDPLAQTFPMIDQEKLRAGKLKVSFMHQYNFGKVVFFKTAKIAYALIIYEEHGSGQTVVTQYIYSNVINVPTKDLIRQGMIQNLKDVVKGSRSYFK